MARRDARTDEQKISSLKAEVEAKERELQEYRVELAKINRDLEKFIHQLSSELKLATLIQKSLVPSEFPHFRGFGFSSKFLASAKGGDYFDIFELEDKMRFGMLMASCSGHGMTSLFMSVLMKLTTDIEARRGMEPNDVLKHITHEIAKEIKGEGLADVFYGVVDRRTYTLVYSHSGHSPAMIYKYAVDKLVELPSTQEAIGSTQVKAFAAESITLEPRDKLILLSTGALKVVNEDLEPIPIQTIQQSVLKHVQHGTCHEIRNEIFYQILKYAEPHKPEDFPRDVTAIVMEIKDKVIKLKKG